MIYTDDIHIVADSLKELHKFARQNSIRRLWFKGVLKGHPHYDCPRFFKDTLDYLIRENYVKKVTTRELLELSKKMLLLNT